MPTYETKDGAQIYYRIHGENRDEPNLIFIHGWCSNSRHWDQQSAFFSKSHRVLSMDRRGMGNSTTPGSGHTTKQHASDIAAIAEIEGFRNSVVVAHAGGGPVGIAFCHDFPALSASFVLVDSAVSAPANLENPTKPNEHLYAEMIKNLQSKNGEQYFKDLYTGFFGPQADPVMVGQAVNDACKTAPDIRIQEIQLLAEGTAARAAAMLQPSLVMFGPWMANTLPDAGKPERIRKWFKRTEVAQAIGCGHFLQMEVPDQVNAFIRSFISRMS